MVVPVLCQFVDNTLAFTVQILGIETHAAMQSPRGGIGRIQQFGNGSVLNIVGNTTNLIEFAWMQKVGGAQLLAFYFLMNIYRSPQIAHILEVIA